MICIYSKDNTEYSKNGDAVLIPTSCYVSMTINGAWSLTLEHPYDPEERYKYIVEGAVIRVDLKCINELTSVQQRFRIYQYTKNMHSVSCIAFPIAMESTYDSPIDNLVITNKTGAEAMALLQTYTEKYTLSTDITAQKSTSFANTNINNAIASGDDNCFISVWGGEILYDNLNYSVKSSLGNNNSGLQIRYGRNLSAIERQTDDSGLTTRIKPISKDGIRLNGAGYVDSPKISDYPIIHTRYMTVPYNLIEDDASSNSATAAATRSAQSAVSSATSTLSQSSYSTALGAGYQPEYIKSIKDDIISAVQTMVLANVISTSLYNYLSKTIASAMSWLGNLEQPAWDWHGSYESGWWYGNDDGYARNEYVRIGKKWSYFGDNGYWQEPADDSDEWDWYQVAGEEGKRYGNFKKYFAHNTYVYITMDGTLTKYWFDSDGWYDSEKTDESDWEWHGSGTAEDPYWFGDPDAEGDEKKYAHSTWLFIDGTYYFFDEFGYYDGTTKFDDYQWDWVESGENFWFGNAEDDTFGAVYVTSQWLKINGSWYYFDSDGYVVSENSSKSAAVTIFTSGMASLGTTVDTQAAALYNVLYGLMTDYANKQYSEGVDVPAITITVNMVDLSKTTEYAGYSDLETVKLGDSVAVKDDEHSINLSSRVIGLTYDCIRDYNAEVVIGSPSKTVSDVLGNAGGTPVAGGFDTTVIETQIEALQDKVGDIFLNDASIVTNGVGRFVIKAGDNISISRSGNVITINGEGGGGNIMYGDNLPTPEQGQDKSMYCQITKALMAINGYRRGGYERDDSWSNINNVYQLISTWDVGMTYHTYSTLGSLQLTQGQRYKISCSAQIISSNPQWTGSNEFFGLAVQNTNDALDGRNVSGGVAKNGAYGEYTVDGHTIKYQSFVEDTGYHTYSFEFTAMAYNYLLLYMDSLIEYNAVTIKIENLTLIDEESSAQRFINIFEKTGNTWNQYEKHSYKAGSNIQITDDTISATNTTYSPGTNVQISNNNVISATDTKYNPFVGATSQTDGSAGLVPAPTIGDVNKYLKGDGTWAVGGGGSSVIANPDGTPTDTLQTIDIDGTIYEIEGGGGGSGSYVQYSELFVPTNSGAVTGTEYTLLDDINNYDFLTFYTGKWSEYVGSVTIANTRTVPVAVLNDLYTRGKHLLITGYTSRHLYCDVHDDKFKQTYNSEDTVMKIIGVKIINPTEIYSTDEQLIGKWINGESLYQKTITTGGNVPSGATLVERTAMASTGYDTIKYIKS